QIRQNSRNAIINWEDFSIDAGELTQFRQPNSSAAVLNRVTGGNPTAIHGALRANGNVFVINPNGILIGAGGTIDVHGLVLSTLDVSNGEFLAGGDMVFKGDSEAGVTNMGRINGIGGDVFLIGKTVTNSGSITAAGTVGLGAGEEVLLTAAENANGERMFVRSTGSGASGTGVLNDGTIEGAAVELKAHGNIYALAINNKGSVRATGATNRGGSVFLEGVGGSVENRGSIEAYSSGSSNVASVLINAAYAKVDGQIRANSSGRGGQVKIAANDTVEISGAVNVSSADGTGGGILVEASDIVVDSTAEIDASGTAGGGLVRIGGGFQGRDEGVLNADSLEVKSGARIFADAIESGDGGQVILWSDELTRFSGEIFARGSNEAAGGFVEVSGKNSFSYSGMVDTGGGTLLLDPSNITITDHAGTPPHTEFNRIDRDDLELALVTQNVVISTQSTETEEGWIQVTDDVNWSSDFNLSLLAEDDIYIQSSLRSSELGGVNLIAGWDSTNTSFLTGTPGSRPYSVPLPSGDVDMQAVFSDPTIYGNDSNADGGTRAGDSLAGFGSIFIGRDEAGALSSVDLFVGSRRGETNVAAHGLYVNRADSNVAAQLGYGLPGAGAATGAITAQVKNGGVTLDAGDSNGAYAQIGHGGLNFGFDKSGVITVKSGNGVSLTGGLHSGGSAYAQIGHGGMNSDGEVGSSAVSDVIVEAGSGAVSLTGGGAAGSSAHYNYAKIGHGGDFVDSAVVGNVSVTGNGVTLAAGGFGDASAGSRFASAQIGHGGREAGPGSGNITIDAGTGNLSVLAGVAGVDFNNAQIGHGGAFKVEGDLEGAVSVTANHIDVVGGGRSQSFARIGHGGWTQGPHTGDRSGDIFVQADGELSVDAGNGVAEIGHHTGTGNLLNANVTVVAASADETAGDAIGSDFEVGSSFADVMERNLAGGDVSLHASGAGGMTIAPGAAMSYSSDNDFSLLSENDLIVEGRIQNSGTGNANLVAGWNPAAAGLADPATGMIADIDMDADIFGNASSYGNNGGAVTISNAAGAASFGSLSGETNVAADSVTLTGTGSGFAQIGFSDHGDGNGN
ncbi:MAG: filamentous hemagglutinin N-terminal domain-containing protein, partial [Verrucomicrobiales bacterium]|nr:filamentous hemagglutinin N-terminal domain-containing protein [Verrucomicrobiales bacterium]